MTAPVDIPALAASAREQGRLGIDTEFVGEGRYQALLCLVQIAVPGQEIAILDPLVEDLDTGPIAEVLADPAVEVVFHAGRQDVAILRREWGTDLTNLFDTQIAAAFAGLGAQQSYARLLQDVLRVKLAKSASFTRWDQRPLTGEQLSYAREDVLHLLELADDLQRRLIESGRLEWAREECRLLETASDARDPMTAWERLPRIGQLDARSRAVARELAAWRERTAAAEDKPLGTIVQDAPLVEVAKRQPREAGRLAQIRGLPPHVLRRRGDDMLAAVARGREAEPIESEDERVGSDPHDAPLVALSESLIRARVLDARLAYELVASRAEITAIVRAVRAGASEPRVRVLEGWRRELVGAELLELLAGRRTMRVETARLVIDGE